MEQIKKTAAVRAGFTLVELVVVIAILGILAGVAYPAYTGYIQRAQDAKVVSKLSEVVVAADSALAIEGLSDDIEEITVTGDGVVTITKPKAPETGGEGVTDWSGVYKSMSELAKNELTYNESAKTITIANLKVNKTSYEEGATWSSGDGGNWTPGIIEEPAAEEPAAEEPAA